MAKLPSPTFSERLQWMSAPIYQVLSDLQYCDDLRRSSQSDSESPLRTHYTEVNLFNNSSLKCEQSGVADLINPITFQLNLHMSHLSLTGFQTNQLTRFTESTTPTITLRSTSSGSPAGKLIVETTLMRRDNSPLWHLRMVRSTDNLNFLFIRLENRST